MFIEDFIRRAEQITHVDIPVQMDIYYINITVDQTQPD